MKPETFYCCGECGVRYRVTEIHVCPPTEHSPVLGYLAIAVLAAVGIALMWNG